MSKQIFKSKDSKLSVAIDTSLLGDEPQSVWCGVFQWIKRVGIATIVLLVLWAVIGTPYLRWDEPIVGGKDGAELSEEDRAFTRYISLGDSRRVHVGEYGKGLPWLIFIPMNDEEERF